MSKVFLFLADGTEESEALITVDLLRRAGIDVVCVSMNESIEVSTANGVRLIADSIFEKTDFDGGDMLIFPGGIPGVDNISKTKGLDELIEKYYQNGSYLAAICAGPTILGKRGYLKGKEATCYPGYESELVGAISLDKDVVVSGQIITARALGASFAFSLQLIEILKDRETAKKVASRICLE